MRFNNPFEAMRMRSAMGAPAPTPTFKRGFVQPPQGELPGRRPSQSELYFDEMDRIQNTVGPGLRAYREALNTMPTREENKPGIFTRIAAGLAGAGAGYRDPQAGVDTARSINEHRFNSAMSDYANRLGTLKEQADIEQDDTNSKLRFLQQARALGLKYDEYELRRLETEARMENDRTNAESNRIRAQASARPGYTAVPQQDGSVLYVNQNNPRDTYTVKGQNIQAGQLGVSRRNAATAEGNLQNSVRRTNIYETSQNDASRRGWTGLSIRNSEAGRRQAPSPREQEDAEDFALRQMMSDPVFADFIEKDRDGFPLVGEDDGSEDYQMFLDALDAKVAEILSGGSRRGRRR